ncbi:MAG: TRIC cation channel family protein [Opitutales bacterium]|nr:TRIC cation channel family protein [Opitutales bacterium]
MLFFACGSLINEFSKPENILLGIEVLGLVAFAASGAIAALKKDLDPIGCLIVGAVAGIGGGTLRDIILDIPVFWLHDKFLYSLNICLATSLIFYIFGKRLARRENIVNWFDAVGLSLFAVQGYIIGISATGNVEISMLMGVLTGCGGGFLRDICLTRQPFIFRGEFYASAALLGLFALWLTHMPILSGVLIFAIRACTIKWHWRFK